MGGLQQNTIIIGCYWFLWFQFCQAVLVYYSGAAHADYLLAVCAMPQYTLGSGAQSWPLSKHRHVKASRAPLTRLGVLTRNTRTTLDGSQNANASLDSSSQTSPSSVGINAARKAPPPQEVQPWFFTETGQKGWVRPSCHF